MKNAIILFVLISSLGFWAQSAYPHCEIPCGIYDDKARIAEISEDIDTVEKSMNMITELSKEGDKNYNQIVRWVDNKETHAGYIQHIVSQYFMTQRIIITDKADKGAHDKYITEVTLLHKMLIFAMKAKQGTDLSVVEELRSLLSQFEASYLGTPAKKAEDPGNAVERLTLR